MGKHTTHCTECGAVLSEDEIAYVESGSLFTEQIELCEYCAQSNGYCDGEDDYFDDMETFLNDLTSDYE